MNIRNSKKLKIFLDFCKANNKDAESSTKYGRMNEDCSFKFYKNFTTRLKKSCVLNNFTNV